MTMELKPSEKYCLSIEEAAIYSGIGENKLRALIAAGEANDWILKIDSRTRIKRKKFEEWIDKRTFV